MMFQVKVFVNGGYPVNLLWHDTLVAAVACANDFEDNGYICEIIKYDNPVIVTREFWRKEKGERN